MKKFKFLVMLIAIFSIFMVGCANNIKTDEKSIEVKKRVSDKDNYENFKVITDSKKVEKVKGIISNSEWEKAKVDMVRPADYQFYFPNPNAKAVLYELWISPNKKQVEMIIDAESQYVHLDKKNSAELFQILTGEKLSEQKINFNK